MAGRSDNIRTVFCGGGTPTILPLGQLAALLQAITELVRLDRLFEFTVEANPATVDDPKAEILVEHGVTRVSMGAQSFVPAELAALERLHSPDDITPSVQTCRRNGVARINLDLIFGIPGQTLDSWSYSLKRALDLGVDHIACYGLTYEAGTPLTAQKRRGRVIPCDEGLEADMYLLAIDALAAAGYEQYEISNFARPGCASRHNLIYWRNEPYIGVGPSACGCIDGRRYKNIADIAGYVRLMDAQGHAEVESELLDTPTLMTEMILMQLRLNEGLSITAFHHRTGVDPRVLFGETLARLTEARLVSVSDSHIALTREGRLMADPIMAELACCCDGGEPVERIPLPVIAHV